jgi:hypothetical protein
MNDKVSYPNKITGRIKGELIIKLLSSIQIIGNLFIPFSGSHLFVGV